MILIGFENESLSQHSSSKFSFYKGKLGARRGLSGFEYNLKNNQILFYKKSCDWPSECGYTDLRSTLTQSNRFWYSMVVLQHSCKILFEVQGKKFSIYGGFSILIPRQVEYSETILHSIIDPDQI